jgi:hypothetical protein
VSPAAEFASLDAGLCRTLLAQMLEFAGITPRDSAEPLWRLGPRQTMFLALPLAINWGSDRSPERAQEREGPTHRIGTGRFPYAVGDRRAFAEAKERWRASGSGKSGRWKKP